VATITFLHSYSLSGDRGQHLLLWMSRTALHIGDCLTALLCARRSGSMSCGQPGRASPESQSARFAWGSYVLLLLLIGRMDTLSRPNAALAFSCNSTITH